MIKQIIILFILIPLFGLSTTCKADTTDNYQIFIGNTLKLTEASFRPEVSQITFLTLDTSNSSDTIHINFNHCTAGASSRHIILTDTAGFTFKVWDFGNKNQKALMSIPIAEILSHPAIARNGSYKLYYQDREYPGWRLLTYLAITETGIKKAAANSSGFGSVNTYLLYGIGFFVMEIMAYLFVRSRKKDI